MSFIKLTDLDLAGKRVLIRADLNVPVKDGKVTSDARITASMPTIERCMKAGASVMVMSHRGRPEEGVADEENSMQPIADDMSAKLGKTVPLVKGYLDKAPEVAAGDVVLVCPNELHQFKNPHAQPLKFLCLVPNTALSQQNPVQPECQGTPECCS